MPQTPFAAMLAPALVFLTVCQSASAAEIALHTQSAQKSYEEKYLPGKSPKAFAQNAQGVWAWVDGLESTEAAAAAALKRCNDLAAPGSPACVVHDIDGQPRAKAAAEEAALGEQFALHSIDVLLDAVGKDDRPAIRRASTALNKVVRPALLVKERTQRSYYNGVRKFRENDLAGAAASLEKAIGEGAGAFQLYYLAGLIQIQLGNDKAADLYLRRALWLDTGNSEAWLAESLALFNLGMPEASGHALIAAYEYAPRPGSKSAYASERRKKDEVLQAMRLAAERETNEKYRTVYQQALVEIDRRRAQAASQPTPPSPMENAEPTRQSAESCQKPAYPEMLRRRSIEGTVMLSIWFGTDGKPVDSAVTQSSGYRELDASAQDALALCKFAVPPNAPTQAQMWTAMKYVYQLR